jgi:phosphoglycerol geranylgeranyltransferase
MKFVKLIKRLGRRKRPMLALLIDPDKYNPELIRMAGRSSASCILVGGSKLEKGNMATTISGIKSHCRLPVIIFPGDETQLSAKADGILLPSLLSGRNPDYLIEKHIAMAPMIRKMKLPHLPFAYILVGDHAQSSTAKVTRTSTLPFSEPDYIVNTAIAAEQLGFRAVYLEAGSGARQSVPAAIIRRVKKKISIPLITGGGIRTAAGARKALAAGADMLVVGNALEKNPELLFEINSCF